MTHDKELIRGFNQMKSADPHLVYETVASDLTFDPGQ